MVGLILEENGDLYAYTELWKFRILLVIPTMNDDY